MLREQQACLSGCCEASRWIFHAKTQMCLKCETCFSSLLRLFLYIHLTSKFFSYRHPHLPSCFHLCSLLINTWQRLLSLSDEANPASVVCMSCFPDWTPSGEKQRVSRQRPTSRHVGDVFETSLCSNELPYDNSRLSVALCWLFIINGDCTTESDTNWELR